MTLQPTAIYSPGTLPPRQNTYNTYNTRINPPPGPSGPPPGSSVNTPGMFSRSWNAIPSQNPIANLPTGVPRFLAARPIVMHTWIVSMIIIGFDEWHNHGIFPRPARLWDTSLLYGVLALLSVSDMLVPIANALAIGYTITLLWNYYNGTGQFSGISGTPGGSDNSGSGGLIIPTDPNGNPLGSTVALTPAAPGAPVNPFTGSLSNKGQVLGP